MPWSPRQEKKAIEEKVDVKKVTTRVFQCASEQTKIVKKGPKIFTVSPILTQI